MKSFPQPGGYQLDSFFHARIRSCGAGREKEGKAFREIRQKTNCVETLAYEPTSPRKI
jgi:hypothetical protein